MSEQNLEQMLPFELKELIDEIYSKARENGDSINMSEIDEILNDKEDFDPTEVVLALISKYLILKKIEVINDCNEDDDDEEDDDDSDEGTEDE